MKDIEFALIVRDASGKRLAEQGSSQQPFTSHQKIAPLFHRACASLLALYKQADRIEAVSWHAGLDLEQAPVLVNDEVAGSAQPEGSQDQVAQEGGSGDDVPA